jgi:c-di-GMP-binding flagellar brake protein YcgR
MLKTLNQGESEMIEEKRKHSRIGSMHLLNYIYLDESDGETIQGMGRTLNVSESGLLLETHNPIDTRNIISLTVGLEEEMVDIKGRIVYSKKNENGMFESGIEFFDIDDPAQRILRRYISEFNIRASK